MCEHCHEEEYNAVILNLEDQDLECGVITIFENNSIILPSCKSRRYFYT